MQNRIYSAFSLRDKIINLDFVLLFSILILGIISMFAQYSSSSGVFDYHAKNHLIRFCVFFILFLVVSFTSINFWHSTSFFVYFIFLLLLILVKYFGISSQGSQRWINLFVINLTFTLYCASHSWHEMESLLILV